MVSPQVRIALETRLAEYLAQPDAEHRRIASLHRALPVCNDLGGTLFITTSGVVLEAGHDDENVNAKPDEGMRIVALLSAMRRYPELEPLRPTRPLAATDCQSCAGSGRVSLGAAAAWCGTCNGLGWQLAAHRAA